MIQLGKYRHYSGKEYEVLGTAKHSETLEELVVYKALYDKGALWVRPLQMFEENVEMDGKIVPRFTQISNLDKRIKVGVGLLVFKDGKVLFGKRKGDHIAGVYGTVGGHLEYGESFQDCARREVREEAGIEIDNIRFLCVNNFKDYAPPHYVDIGVVADWKSGEPQLLEPHKCEGWSWHDLDNLPTPMMSVLNNYFEAYKTGKKFFDK